jgi:hypothetical protein
MNNFEKETEKLFKERHFLNVIVIVKKNISL